VAAFVVACLVLSGGKDLWLDELFTWYQVKDKSFASLRDATATGFNLMPLGYFSLLWSLDKVGVLTFWTARVVSIGAAVGGILVMIRLWRRWWGAHVTLVLTGILVGSSAPLLTMAVEVRPYALSFLLAVVSLDCACRFVRCETTWRIWMLNAGCSFALPYTSYPAGAYSAALAMGIVVAGVHRGQRPLAGAMTSFAAGWGLFFAVGLQTLADQMRSNPIGVRNAAPHVTELFEIYSTLVWYPLAIVLVVGIGTMLSQRTDRHGSDETANLPASGGFTWPMLHWLLVPAAYFILAKIRGPVIWGGRFFLPTAAALTTAAGPVVAAFLNRRPASGRWCVAVGLAAMISMLAMTSTFWSANRDAPVRRFSCQLTPDVASLPIVVREMNTYLHLLYYGDRRLDLRLYADDQANEHLLRRVSARFNPVVGTDLWQLPAFAVLVDQQVEWTNRLATDLAGHHLMIAERRPVRNDFVREIWIVRKAL
jgi:hypothetical protein